jgi:hypothetical protein
MQHTQPSRFQLGLVQVSEVIGRNVILPLAIGTLWAQRLSNSAVNDKWELSKTLYLNLIDDLDITELSKCHMVCFSTYIWNIDHHVDIAKKIKKINPNCYIVAGGPQFAANDDDFWQHHRDVFDLLLLGEGEQSFVELLSVFPDHQRINQIPGAWSEHITPTLSPRIVNTEQLHSPYLTGFYDQIVKQVKQKGHLLQAVIQTNRGCPYHCTFCEEGTDYHNKLHTMHIDRIFQEIEWCGINQVEYLTIADDNFGILNRDVQIMEKLCQTKLKYGYPKILDTTWAKNNTKNILEIIKIDSAYQTDLIRSITVAVQSKHSATLNAIKRFNLEDNKQKIFLNELKKYNVPNYAEIIWPLPFETYDSLCMGFESILDQGADNWIGMYPLALLKSAQLYHDFKDYYQFAPAQSDRQNQGNRAYMSKFSPMSSTWADHNNTVKGHVFYMWMTSLYFFGFARPAIDLLKNKLEWPISKSINHLMNYLDNNTCTVSIQHKKLKKFYSDWLMQIDIDDLNQFPDRNVDFWYPFTHHASWLQINYNSWIDTLENWLMTCIPSDAKQITKICNYSTVKFKQTYPYIDNDITVELNHTQPEFNDVYEFCRFYYWWKRKNGYSRTQIFTSPI